MRRHRVAVTIASAALLLGIAADVLLRWIPWGLNALLWTALFVGSAALARRRASAEEETAKSLQHFAATASILLAACIAWRDSPWLVALDVALLLVFLPMMALSVRGVRVAAAGLVEIGGALVTTLAQSVAGFPQLLLRDLSWSRVPRGSFRGLGIAVRGTLIAVPALLLFGTLLVSADPRFGQFLADLFSLDLRELMAHLLVTAVVAAICAGFLRSLALSGEMPRVDRPEIFSMPTAETSVALVLIDLLFAAFVAVQFPYFFRGAELTASEYARRGFFELVWVVALVLPMLLVVDWLLREKRLFRILAGIQVALVFVIAASAWRRMELYRDEFGLTRLRLFTTAFMIWVAVLLLWFVLTVLTGRRHRFAIGVLSTGVATVIALHAINPDALIVENNLQRARSGRRALDAEYVMQLSDDAAPVIAANRNAFAPPLLQRYATRPRSSGWRSWNLSRTRAIEAVRTLRVPAGTSRK
jgi:hypothetical protein